MLWNDIEKANDFTQDLFSKIIEKPERYKKGNKFSSWLYSIAANMCKNEYRSVEVRSRAAIEIQYRDSNVSLNDERTDANLFKHDLDQAMNLLNDEQRIAFIMKYKQGFKIKEIAECLECSEGTVKSRLFYALKKLSTELSVYNPKSEL
jgi:RNA polymerase sigma-70 factor (ECF subfamily)